jgi:thioredoxin-like negative regulator of GroEL
LGRQEEIGVVTSTEQGIPSVGALQDAPPQSDIPLRPHLVFFYAPTSGRCRRVNGFLALVLQRRRNHQTFKLTRVPVDEHPEIAERFEVTCVPTIVVVEEKRVRVRLENPKGRSAIEEALSPWLH